MPYIKSELDRAVELMEWERVKDFPGWLEEYQKSLVPLRYLKEFSHEIGEAVDQTVVLGYLTAFLRHADSLLADAYQQGWTNHPRNQED